MKVQTQKLMQLAAVVVAAVVVYHLFFKKSESFRYQNPLTEEQIPLYNDIGPRTVSSTGSYATLGESCSACKN